MYESHMRGSESHTERLVCVLPAQCAARPRVHRWLCARAVAQYPQAPEEAKRLGQRKRSLPMAKYLLLRGGLVLLKTSTHCGMPIFLKVNHQLESRIQEIWPSGSEGGAKPTLSLPLSQPRVSTLGTNQPTRRALKGRQIERPNKVEIGVQWPIVTGSITHSNFCAAK